MKTTCHCGRFAPAPITRRQMLLQCANGFGGIALMALMGDKVFGGISSKAAPSGPMTPRPPHYEAKARNVSFLYMDGGPSQMDTFDPKPRLQKENGQPFKMKMEPTQFNNNGNTLGSPWKFKNHGKSGLAISDLFPHIAESADELAI